VNHENLLFTSSSAGGKRRHSVIAFWFGVQVPANSGCGLVAGRHGSAEERMLIDVG